MTPALKQGRRVQGLAGERAQLGDGTTIPAHDEALAGLDAVDYGSPVVAELPNRYRFHVGSVSHVIHRANNAPLSPNLYLSMCLLDLG